MPSTTFALPVPASTTFAAAATLADALGRIGPALHRLGRSGALLVTRDGDGPPAAAIRLDGEPLTGHQAMATAAAAVRIQELLVEAGAATLMIGDGSAGFRGIEVRFSARAIARRILRFGGIEHHAAADRNGTAVALAGAAHAARLGWNTAAFAPDRPEEPRWQATWRIAGDRKTVIVRAPSPGVAVRRAMHRDLGRHLADGVRSAELCALAQIPADQAHDALAELATDPDGALFATPFPSSRPEPRP